MNHQRHHHVIQKTTAAAASRRNLLKDIPYTYVPTPIYQSSASSTSTTTSSPPPLQPPAAASTTPPSPLNAAASDRHRIDEYFSESPFATHIAFYDTFPGTHNAERELLKRFESVCAKLQVGFILITHDGHITKHAVLNGMHLDEVHRSHILFVLSLHFWSVKTTTHFTLMVLWNPLQYYTPADFQNMARIDAFISAGSCIIDQEIARRIQPAKPILRGGGEEKHHHHLQLHPTTHGPLMDVTFGEYKCFYCGINWCSLPGSESVSRNHILRILKVLEQEKLVSIYGPKRFHNVDVWKDFSSSYAGPINFNGYSIVNEIHACGICLALSSKEHVACEVVSCRLFEGLAAGVPIICNRNPFIVRWFGDNVFYIDDSDPDIAVQQIKDHIAFFRSSPDTVLLKLHACREIFIEHFLLDKQLQAIIAAVARSNTHTAQPAVPGSSRPCGTK